MTDSPAAAPLPRAINRSGRTALWLAGCIVHAAAVAWIAASVERHSAPFLVFPIAVGLALGVGIVALAKWCQIERRRKLVAGATLAAAIVVLGQHYFAYLHATADLHDAAERRAKALSKFPGLAAQLNSPVPVSFFAFLDSAAQRGRDLPGGTVAVGIGVWLSWLFDGLLVAAGSLAVIWLATSNSARPLDEPPGAR